MPDVKPVKSERIDNDEQLRRWVEGDSVHRIVDDMYGGECCPDFSCCKPELLADVSIRKAFAAAGEKERMTFLGHFLGAAIESAKNSGEIEDKEIIVIDDRERS